MAAAAALEMPGPVKFRGIKPTRKKTLGSCVGLMEDGQYRHKKTVFPLQKDLQARNGQLIPSLVAVASEVTHRRSIVGNSWMSINYIGTE